MNPHTWSDLIKCFDGHNMSRSQRCSEFKFGFYPMIWHVSVLERHVGKNAEDCLCGLISVAPRLDLKGDVHLTKPCMRLGTD